MVYWRGAAEEQDDALSPLRQPVFEDPTPSKPSPQPTASPASERRRPALSPQPASSFGVPPDPAEQKHWLRQQHHRHSRSPASGLRSGGAASQSASFRVPDDSSDDEDGGGDGGGGGDDGATSAVTSAQHGGGAASTLQYSAGGGAAAHRRSSASAAGVSSAGAAAAAAAAASFDPVHAVQLARARSQRRAAASSGAAAGAAALAAELEAIERRLSGELARLSTEAGTRAVAWARRHEDALARLAAARARREEQLGLGGDSAEARRVLDAARQQREEAQRRAEAEAKRKADEEEQRRRQQQQQQQQEQEARARAEAEAKRKAEEDAKAKAAAAAAEAAAQQQQQQQQSQPQQQQQQQQPLPPPGGDDPDVRAAPGALAWERKCAERLRAAQASVADLMTRPELKPQRRQIEKRVTLVVSQIAGTQQQINDKVDELLRLLQSCPDDAARTLTCLTLATRMVAQCEGQVLSCASFAFPLALVCARVGGAAPAFIELLVAKLHQACPLTVPKYYVYRPGGGVTEAQHFARLGYKRVEDAAKPGATRLETTDEFAARAAAYVHLYAALVGTPLTGNAAGAAAAQHHPHPVANGWAWAARHLNALPAARATAAALHAFLAHAGFALAMAYRRQFDKLLAAVGRSFLPDLAARDADAAAAAARLQTYLEDRAHLEPPEGLVIKKTDVSSWWGQRDEPPQGGGGRW